MRKLIVATLLAVSALGAYADDTHEVCTSMSRLAEVIMTGRQDGVSVSGMMGATDDAITKLLIMEAYTIPRFRTDSVKQTAIEDFRDRWYMACTQARSDT